MPASTPGRSGTCTRSALQLARVGVLAVEHPAPVLRRLADPTREEARVALLERRLDLLDAAAMLCELLADLLRRCRG